MKTLNVAKTIVLNGKGEVLLLRRSATDPQRPGEWDFPGGHIEPGEELLAGAGREIDEETGLKIPASELNLVYTGTTAYEELSINRLLFVARVGHTAVHLSHEHDAYRWVDVQTALADFPHPFYGTGLQYALDHKLLQES